MRLFIFLMILCCSVANASVDSEAGLRMSYSQDIERAHIYLGSEVMNVASSTSSLMGFGPRAGFEYGLLDKWSIGSDVVFAFQANGKAGAFFYSGIKGIVRYALQGSCLRYKKTLSSLDGSLIYNSKTLSQRRTTLFFGVDQLFINGVASIYPAVGMTAGASYGFDFLGRDSEVDVRYSTMTANDNPLNMIGIGFRVNLDF